MPIRPGPSSGGVGLTPNVTLPGSVPGKAAAAAVVENQIFNDPNSPPPPLDMGFGQINVPTWDVGSQSWVYDTIRNIPNDFLE